MKAKPFMVFIFAAVLLWLAAGCAKDSPAPEVLEAEDLKALQRPGVELSFDSKSLTAHTPPPPLLFILKWMALYGGFH